MVIIGHYLLVPSFGATALIIRAKVTSPMAERSRERSLLLSAIGEVTLALIIRAVAPKDGTSK